jgi:hypothetical protein
LNSTRGNQLFSRKVANKEEKWTESGESSAKRSLSRDQFLCGETIDEEELTVLSETSQKSKVSSAIGSVEFGYKDDEEEQMKKAMAESAMHYNENMRKMQIERNVRPAFFSSNIT